MAKKYVIINKENKATINKINQTKKIGVRLRIFRTLVNVFYCSKFRFTFNWWILMFDIYHRKKKLFNVIYITYL